MEIGNIGIGNTSTLAKFDIPPEGGVNLTRREFVKGGLASLGFLALPDGLFAAPAGWKPKGRKPNLVLGVLSDTHLMVNPYNGKTLYPTMSLDYIRNAFKFFKAKNIDAFVHLGDASHRSDIREWEFHKEVYEEVFGKRGTGNWERGTGHPFSREGLLKVIGSPEFPPKAKLEVKLEKRVGVGERRNSTLQLQLKSPTFLSLKIPEANGNPASRALAYDVVVMGDDPKARYFKSVYFSGVNAGVGHEPNKGLTRVEIPVSELPAGKKLTIAVRPVSSLGTKGKTIGV